MLAAFVLYESASPWSALSAISNPFNLAAYALKTGYRPARQYYFAGDKPAELILEK
jgi:hypothetical protein